MIEIEKIKIKELCEFATNISSDSRYKDVVPITQHRALALVHNPHADDNDVALLLAYRANRCIGYLSIMPGTLKAEDRIFKMYWFGSFFVAPELRGKGVGSLLVKYAFSLGYDFASTSMSASSERAFRRAGMQELAPLEYSIIDLKMLALPTLPLRLLREIFRKCKVEPGILNRVIKIADFVFLPFVKYIAYGVLAHFQKNYQWLTRDLFYRQAEKLSEGDSKETSDSIEFYRGTKIINWMLEYTWRQEPAEAQAQDFKYFFSLICDVFRFFTLKIYSSQSKEDYKGFLIFSFFSNGCDSILKVLDFQIEGNHEYASFLILQYALMYKADRIEFPNILIPDFNKSLLLRLISRRKKRTYLYYSKNSSSPLNGLAGEIRPSYSDGDSAFF